MYQYCKICALSELITKSRVRRKYWNKWKKHHNWCKQFVERKNKYCNMDRITNVSQLKKGDVIVNVRGNVITTLEFREIHPHKSAYSVMLNEVYDGAPKFYNKGWKKKSGIYTPAEKSNGKNFTRWL